MDNENVLPSWAHLEPDGRIALFLDNLLLSTFNECEQKFAYRHVMNRVQKGTGTGASAAQELGIWWSETLERFYKGMMAYQKKEPDSTEPSVMSIINAAGAAWAHCNMDANGNDGFEDKYKKAYDRFGGHDGAILMANMYWETFGEYDTRNWKIVAMEYGFGYGREVLLHEDNEILVYWCGRPDLVVYEEPTDQLMCVEHKSTEYMKSNFINKWKPHPQTYGYVRALSILCTKLGFNRDVDRCIINGAGRLIAIRAQKGGRKPRFLRPRPHYSAAELQEWVEATGRKAKTLWSSYQANVWTWRESACHLYAGCRYRGICSIPPASRSIILSTDYVQIEPWKPYEKPVEEGEEDDG